MSEEAASEVTSPAAGPAPSQDELTKAYKAFKKRLKLTQLDFDSRIGASPLERPCVRDRGDRAAAGISAGRVGGAGGAGEAQAGEPGAVSVGVADSSSVKKLFTTTARRHDEVHSLSCRISKSCPSCRRDVVLAHRFATVTVVRAT